ncbi:MAG: hypothetical protein H0W48_00135 [Methylibium sp.]|nr:hypothetical protein [Methylibium sp.]
MTFSVVLPIKAVSVLNTREHHMARYKRTKLHREAVRWACPWLVRTALPCTVTLTRIAPRPLDQHDNLQASCKAIVDEIADRLGVKDNDVRVQWKYAQERGAPKTYAVRVEVQAT